MTLLLRILTLFLVGGAAAGVVPTAVRSHVPPRRALPRSTAPDTALIGTWGAEQSFGPLVRGELRMVRTATRWSAQISGFEIVPRTARDSIWVTVPDRQGEFRGRILPDSQAIVGFWIQPPGVVSGVPYASPLRLQRDPANRVASVWSGVVVPLEDQFSLYLTVWTRSDGSLFGAFHNPDANSRGGAAAFSIERVGATVRFKDTATGEHVAAPIVATFDSTSGQLIVPWTHVGRPLALTRRTRDDAIGLYPRTPASPDYVYRQPLAAEDGWTTDRAAHVGLGEQPLTALVRAITDGDPRFDSTSLIQSVLIARHGRLVLEEYFFGYDQWRPHDLRSASKTFASVVAGATMMHGATLSPSTRVYAALDSEGPFDNPDPRKQEITVGQLLTHSSGLACDDNDDASPGNEGTMQSQQAQPDWYKYTLNLPVTHDPGQHYAYCSATMNLVGGVLAAVEHAWLPTLVDKWVAQPLQFRRYYVNLMPTGQAYFGGGMYVVPRDLLKLGVTYLQGGIWNGRRIVTSAWVRASTAQQVGSPGDANADGYGWHRRELTSGGRTFREYEANGNGGQFLIVLPDLDVAVVMTGADYGRYGIWRRWRDALVPEYVIGAVVAPRH